MKGILGKKLGMTQVFTAEGNVVPVTVIRSRTMCGSAKERCGERWL